MNYRHAYHAGNFADVVKHAVLVRVLEYMKRKPAPFRVIDTHAGAGRYDLQGSEAVKTGEWEDGIGRLMTSTLESPVIALLEPYLAAVRAVNADEELRFYPGSPRVARSVMRGTDALVANELRADDFKKLQQELRGARATSVLNLDGWLAIKSLLPPKERRGVVLIDPPFESRDEFAAMAAAMDEGLRRFATGTFIFWYPVKDEAAAEKFYESVARRGDVKFLELKIAVAAPFPGLGLTEMGLLIANPPHVLEEELGVLLPSLARLLAENEGSGYSIRSSDL